MRVLLVANDVSTIVQFRLEFVEELVARGHEVSVVVPTGESMARISEVGSTVLTWKVTRRGKHPLAELRALFDLRRLVRGLSPDVIVTYTVKPNLYVALVRTRVQSHVATVTGLGSAILHAPGLVGRGLLCVQRLLVSRADAVFFQNDSNLAAFRGTRKQRENFMLVPGSGVNLVEFAPREYPRERGTLRLAVVSRVQADKGIRELLDLLDRAHRDRWPIHVDVVGWPVEEELVEELRRWEGIGLCSFHGTLSRSALRRVLSEAHALVHPSYHEGMSNAVLEAAASGRPVLASDIPGCREGVVHGRSGLLFEARSGAALQDAVQRLMDYSLAELAEMGRAGRAHVEAGFDRRFVVREYVRVVEMFGEGRDRAPSPRRCREKPPGSSRFMGERSRRQ